MKNESYILSKVKKAEVPPYLYTRIMQGIKALEDKKVPFKWKLSWAVAAALLLLFNVISFTGEENRDANSQVQTSTENVYDNVVNDIYHD